MRLLSGPMITGFRLSPHTCKSTTDSVKHETLIVLTKSDVVKICFDMAKATSFAN